MRTHLALAAIVLLGFVLVHASPAAAQITPVHPRQTVGVGLGVSDDGNWSGDGRHLIVSGTYEWPFAGSARIRIDGGRTQQPIPPMVSPSLLADTATISRLTVSLAAIKRSLAPIAPYGGGGIGFYHSSFERARSVSRRGGHLYAGIEVEVGDVLAVDVEGGLHVIPKTLYPEGALLGEVVVRAKIGW
jgi:hypothetical protein